MRLQTLLPLSSPFFPVVVLSLSSSSFLSFLVVAVSFMSSNTLILFHAELLPVVMIIITPYRMAPEKLTIILFNDKHIPTGERARLGGKGKQRALVSELAWSKEC